MRIWLMAARPRTLPAAIAPGARRHGARRDGGRPARRLAFVAALLGAIFIQVGTNLSNDYSDARRGADTEERLGPVRVTAGGLVPPRQVLVATYVTLRARGRVRRLPRRRSPGPMLLAIGARVDPRRRPLHRRPAAVRLRGPRRGLRVPVLRPRRGRRLVLRADRAGRRGRRSSLAVPVGLLASAILVVNNVRDIETDRRAGKRTLAVRLGRRADADGVRPDGLPRVPHRAAAVDPRRAARRGCCCRSLLLPLAVMLVRLVRTHTDGPTLNRALARTGMLQLGFCVLLSIGPAAELMDVRIASLILRFARPLETAYGELHERELRPAAPARRRRRRRLGRGRAARALRRRPARGGARGARGLRADPARRRRPARRRAPRRLPRRRRPPPGARRRRPRAVGPRGQPRGPARSASCITDEPRRERPRQRDDRAPRTAPARPRRPPRPRGRATRA